MSEQGKKYKKQTVRENRQNDKTLISKGDESVKKGKKRGGRTCSGWIMNGWRGCGLTLTKESLPCDSCHRKFCSTECHDSHKELCQLKKDKDRDGMEAWAKRIYDTYVDDKGFIKKKFKDEDGRDYQEGNWGYSTLGWKHRDISEANDILKKVDVKYFRGTCRPYMWPAHPKD